MLGYGILIFSTLVKLPQVRVGRAPAPAPSDLHKYATAAAAALQLQLQLQVLHCSTVPVGSTAKSKALHPGIYACIRGDAYKRITTPELRMFASRVSNSRIRCW